MQKRMGFLWRLLAGAVPVWAVFGFVVLWGAQARPSAEAQPPPEATVNSETELLTAVFAGGCFWCMEPPYDALDGVVETVSGFAGGHIPNPSYEQVTSGGTGHLEVVQVRYDPRRVSYERLLEVFWVNIDPLDGGGQFCDRGEHYTSAIFYLDKTQRAAAERSKELLTQSGRFGGQQIMTSIQPLNAFYPAEEYHQDFYLKNPLRYRFYRNACGRDRRLQELWQGSALEF